MRCLACDEELNDYESTRKSAVTGEYYDLCNTCLETIKEDVYVIDRPELLGCGDYSDDSNFHEDEK
jgi:hypothetical protein